MKKCVVCGREIEAGIACDTCDRPRSSKGAGKASAGPRRAGVRAATSSNVLPFPGAASDAVLRAAWDALNAAEIPSAMIARDGTVRYIADTACELLEIDPDTQLTRDVIEEKIGWKLPHLSETLSSTVILGGREIDFSLVPLSEGADGSALLFRLPVLTEESALIENVVEPLRALRRALKGAERHRETNPLLDDTTATISRILEALDSREVSHRSTPASIPQLVRQVAGRYAPIAKLKDISLEVDVPDLADVIPDSEDLTQVFEILVENSLHYVPAGGQIFIGARTTEHKKKKLALFFVMDNGPLVPEELRQEIFASDFDWEYGTERTGRRLSECFDFATRHEGQCWVECKSGKSCTFFLSVRLR